MISIKGLKKGIKLYPIPVIKNEMLCPAGMEFGKVVHVSAILRTEESAGSIAIMENIKSFNEINSLIIKGIKAFIIKHPMRFEVERFPKDVLIFYTNPEDYEYICNNIGKKIEIDFNLSYYVYFENNYVSMVCDVRTEKDKLAELLTDSYKMLSSYLSNYFTVSNKKLRVYCFEDDDFYDRYAFMDGEYAYKNYYIVLNGNNIAEYEKSGSRFHEMTHILLYDYERPVFLFKEGVPCLIAFLFGNTKDIEKYYLGSNDYMQVKLEEMLCDQNMNYRENEYYDAALYCLYEIYIEYGMETVAYGFKKINCLNSFEENYRIFKESFKRIADKSIVINGEKYEDY